MVIANGSAIEPGTKLPAEGRVTINVVEGADARGGNGLCFELENDDAMMTSDFAPNEVCNFWGPVFDDFEHDKHTNLLHDPEGPTRPVADPTLYETRNFAGHFERWLTLKDNPHITTWIGGDPPDRYLNLARSCEPCGPLEFSGQGVCTPCPPQGVPRGAAECPTGAGGRAPWPEEVLVSLDDMGDIR